jgi:hypothetical protein
MRSSCGGSPRPTGSTLRVPPITAACGGVTGARGPSRGPSRVSPRWTSAGRMAHGTRARGNRNSPRSLGNEPPSTSVTPDGVPSSIGWTTVDGPTPDRLSASCRLLPAGRSGRFRDHLTRVSATKPLPAAERRELAIGHVRAPYRGPAGTKPRLDREGRWPHTDSGNTSLMCP